MGWKIRIQGWDEGLEYKDGMKDYNTRIGWKIIILGWDEGLEYKDGMKD